MSAVCGKCGKPFVRRDVPDMANRTATWRSEQCPDCAPRIGAATMDCFQYMQGRRLTARLRDGYQLLAEEGQ